MNDKCPLLRESLIVGEAFVSSGGRDVTPFPGPGIATLARFLPLHSASSLRMLLLQNAPGATNACLCCPFLQPAHPSRSNSSRVDMVWLISCDCGLWQYWEGVFFVSFGSWTGLNIFH